MRLVHFVCYLIPVGAPFACAASLIWCGSDPYRALVVGFVLAAVVTRVVFAPRG